MKVVIGFFATLVVLVVAAVVAVPMLLPLDRLVQEVQREVKSTLGRELRLADPSVSVFPNLVVSLNSVALASPAGFKQDLVNIGSIDIDVAWSSVWQGELAVNRFALSDLTLHLITNESGEVNWAMTSGAQSSSGNGTVAIPEKVDVALNNVALNNARVVIVNAATKSAMRIEDINVALDMDSLDSELAIDGKLTMLGEALSASIKMNNVRRLLAGQSTRVALLFEGYKNRVDFEGDVIDMGQRISGKLALGDVDLVDLLGGESSAPSANNETSTATGWSDDPIDLTGLIGPDVDLQVSMNSLATPWVNTGELQTGVVLRGGNLTMDVSKFAAYGGEGSGVFRIDANQSTTRSNFDLRGIDIQPLLKDLVDIDKLLGSGDVNFSINAKLNSMRAIMQSLGGKASVSLADGAVLGFNLAAILKSAQRAIKGDFASVSLDQNFAAAEKTDFSSMSASFDIASGVLSSRDTQLLSPLLRVTGEGTVDLPQQGVDYLLTSRLVASSVGQGAAGDESGLAIPVSVKGPWADVKVSPKLSSALKEKSKAKVEEVKQEGKQKLQEELDKVIDKNLKDEDKKKLLKGLFSR